MSLRGLISRTPFGSRASSAIWSLAIDAETSHAGRIQDYREYERFYRGDQWNWNRGDDDPTVTVNYARAMVDTMVNFLFKKGFKISIPDDPSTEVREDDDREFIRYALEQQWAANYSAHPTLDFEIGQMGAVTGDVFLRVSWERNPEFDEPFARVDVLPSRYVFPEFGGPDGVDGRKVNSVLVLFPRYVNGDEVHRPINKITARGRKAIAMYAERWYPDRVEYWDETISGEPVIKENPLGEIPIVHISNYPVMSGYYGRSDLADMIDLQREFNEKATDVSDVINYHGSPVTVVTGARLGQLEMGANRLWGLPEGASVDNLSLNGELGASMAYLKMIRTAMHEVSGVPEGTLGAFQDADATGVALAMRYMPLLERRDVKVKTYGLGLRRVNRLMLKTMDLMDDEFHAKFDKIKKAKYRNEVTFPDPLPRDEALELDKAEKRLMLGLSTRRHELEAKGLSQAEITDILDGWLEDKKQLAEMEFELGQKLEDPFDKGQENRGGNPDPDRSNKTARGAAKSRNASPV